MGSHPEHNTSFLFRQGTKCLLKQDLARLPVLGWSWWFLEYTFLSRNWEKDRPKLTASLRRLADFPFPYWVGAP